MTKKKATLTPQDIIAAFKSSTPGQQARALGFDLVRRRVVRPDP